MTVTWQFQSSMKKKVHKSYSFLVAVCLRRRYVSSTGISLSPPTPFYALSTILRTPFFSIYITNYIYLLIYLSIYLSIYRQLNKAKIANKRRHRILWQRVELKFVKVINSAIKLTFCCKVHTFRRLWIYVLISNQCAQTWWTLFVCICVYIRKHGVDE